MGRIQAATWLPVAGLLAASVGSLGAQAGSICGLVVEESQTQVAEAEVQVLAAGASEPVASLQSDARGEFCVDNLAPGTYTLKVAKKPWPDQPPRTIEVEQSNIALIKIEIEYEPGDPRARYEESLDGLDPGERRGVIEQLLLAGDAAHVQELARRLVPKRSVGIELGRLTRGLDTRKLVDELIRTLERGYLPPLKTARFLHALGELSPPGDERAIVVILRKLSDGRRLPPGNYATYDGLYDPARQYYVSDEAALALAKLTGRDFKYQVGRAPIANQRAIDNAREWWRQEQLKKADQERRR